MGKNTKIIATVVPVRMDKDANALILDVFFSPRLPDSGLLEDYYEIKNWPAYADVLKKLNFHLELFAISYTETNKKFTYSPHSTQPALIKRSIIEIVEKKDPFIRYRFDDGSFFRSDNEAGYPLSKQNPVSAVLWNQMVRNDTPVSGWLINEVDYNLAAKLSRSELINSLRDAIDRTIEELISNGYSSGSGGTTPGEISSFVMYLQQLKRKGPEVIANDPLLRKNPVNTYQRLFANNLRETIEALIDKNERQVRDQGIILTAQEQEIRNAQETGEFHKRFSAYSNYPFLLRNTGWIWELKVPLSEVDEPVNRILDLALANGQQYLKYIKLSFPDEIDWNTLPDEDKAVMNDRELPITDAEQKKRNKISKALFLHEIDILSPGTCFEINKADTVFQPGSNPEFGKQYFKIDHGVIVARPQPAGSNIEYEIRPQLIDKIQLFEKLRGILNDNISKLNSVSGPSEDQSFLKSVSEEFKDVQGNSRGSSKGNEYVSNGISLNIQNLKEVMQNVLSTDPETQAGSNAGIALGDTLKTIKDGLIYAHNLHVGYRVDVAMFEGTKLLGIDSLCKRKEYYCICVGKGNVWAENPSETEEGWLMESTQASQSGLTYVDDELFRWNDWSLVCPQIGEHEDVERPDDEALKDPTKLNITEVPPDGSLIPLRFGNNYRFRLRVVDICGNNSGYLDVPVTQVDADDIRWTNELPYQRLDSINTPLIIPGHRIYSGVTLVDNDPAKRRLIWDEKRMGEDLETLVIRAYFEDNKLKTEQSSVRYIGPPKANLHFVVKHKVLDSILADHNSAEAIKYELFDRADLEVMPSDIYFKSSREPINYLFDPVVTGFDAIHGRKRHERKQVAQDHLANAESPYWKPWQFMELRLDRPGPGDNDPVTIRDGGDGNLKMTVIVKQGVETNILLGCTYFGDIDPIFHECVDKVKRTNIKLIHAVQKPCLLETAYPDSSICQFESCCEPLTTPLSRIAEKNNFTFRMFFDRYPVHTTDSAILHMQYADIVCDRTTTEGYRFDHVQKVIKTGLQPSGNVSESNVSFNNLEYVFPDSKFRRVNLRMESVSKFKQYFNFKPKSDRDLPDYFSVFASHAPWIDLKTANSWIEGEHVVRKDWQVIANTTRPAPLAIERIVPLISWTKNGDTVERYTDTIRIYFEGDWYSSGEEEKVAVFYLDEGDANSACVPLELENVISQFGKDPAGGSQVFEKWTSVLQLLSDKTMFPSAAGYQEGIEVGKLDFNTSPTADQPFCTPAATPVVKAAIFNIQYAPPAGPRPPASGIDSQDELGKFYVDIKLNVSMSKWFYFPFVRFAIARYQEHSLVTPKDYRFSKITVTDFVQLLPYRKLDIVRNKSKNEIELKLETPVCREDEKGAPLSKVYVYTKDIFFVGNRQLAERNIHEPREVLSTGTASSITVPVETTSVFQKFVVEEYEEYEREGTLEDEKNPRMDFTQRLIFSYIVDL
jgi:hypothetical protein